MNSNHDVTIGVEFAAKNLKINRKTIKLQIWDTAGQENFRSITRSYYRSAIGALLIYDITRRDTFQHLQEWMEEVNANGNEAMQVLLIGNKTDLENEREVAYEEGKAFADKHKLKFLEITATDYKKVETAFNTLSESILAKIDKGEISELTTGIKVSDDIKIDPLSSRPTKKEKCC